jgi:phosphatidylglycerol---prolipoprotein diacylglyceryl transferase
MWPVWAEAEIFGHPLWLTGYGVFAVLGAVVAGLVCVLRARRSGFEVFDALAVSALAFAFGLVGSKVLFLVVSLPKIVAEGIGPFIAHGGLVWYGGVLGGMAAALVYLIRYDLDVLKFADCAAPALAVGHAFGRVGCFMAGCCWGRPTSLPWGARFPSTPFFDGPVGVPLHPVQLYEAAAELLLGGVTFIIAGRTQKGTAAATWIIGYGAVRAVMEVAFRADDRGAGLFGWPPSLVLSLLAIGAGVALYLRPCRRLTTVKIVS